MGDQFATFVMSVLSNSGVRIEELTFAHATRYYSGDWGRSSGWRSLDLSKLRVLRFEPLWRCEGGFVGGRTAALEGLEGLLRVVGGRLEELDCGKATMFTWSGSPVALPKLRTLVLAGRASSTYLVEWIESCPELEKLGLKSMTLDNEFTANWQSVIEAVHGHAKRPKIELEGDWTDEAVNILLPRERRKGVRVVDDPWDNGAQWDTLSGTTEWNFF
jgi:hypothetical protein